MKSVSEIMKLSNYFADFRFNPNKININKTLNTCFILKYFSELSYKQVNNDDSTK